jgi:hypothetical protein
MAQYVFPTEFVFHTKNTLHEQHKADLLPQIVKNLSNTDGPLSYCNVNTEYHYRTNEENQKKYFDLIHQSILPSIDLMYSEIKGLRRISNPMVTNIWYNYYSASEIGWQNIHAHYEGKYSGLYILTLDGSNTTMFFSQLASIHGLTDPDLTTDFAAEGDILLFPSSLCHYTLPTKQERIAISFDINFTRY